VSPAPALPRSPRGERGEASGELARLVAISDFRSCFRITNTKTGYIRKQGLEGELFSWQLSILGIEISGFFFS